MAGSEAYLMGVKHGTDDYNHGGDYRPADLGDSYREGYADGWQVAHDVGPLMCDLHYYHACAWCGVNRQHHGPC